MRRQVLLIIYGRSLGALLYAVLLVLVARGTSLDLFGRLSSTMSTVAFLAAFFDFGLAGYLARERAASHRPQVTAALRMTCWAALSLAVTVTAILAGVSGAGILPATFIAIGLAAAADNYTDTVLSLSVADRRVWVLPVSLAVRRGTLGLAWAGLVMASVDPVTAWCLAMGLAALLGLLHARWSIADVDVGGTALVRPGDLWGELWPFTLSSVTAGVRNVDVALVGFVSGAGQAAYYGASSRLLSPVWLVTNSLTQVLLPSTTRLSTLQAKSLMWRVVGLHALVLLGCLPVAWASRTILVLLFGADYGNAAPVLATALLWLPVVTLSYPLGALLQGRGEAKFVAAVGVGTSGLLLVTMLGLAVMGGALGVAWAVGLVFLLKNLLLMRRIVTISA